MTTFVFVLKRGAGSASNLRMLAELENRFPQHDFLIGDVELQEYEGNILALSNGDDAALRSDEVGAVVDFFRKTSASIEGWKPS